MYKEDTVYYLIPSILVQECSVRAKSRIAFGDATEMCASCLDSSDVLLIRTFIHQELVELILYTTNAEAFACILCADMGMHMHAYSSTHTHTDVRGIGMRFERIKLKLSDLDNHRRRGILAPGLENSSLFQSPAVPPCYHANRQ